jgi:hypothetical protein
MKKILFISALLCIAIVSRSQSKQLSLIDIFKMTECSDNRCMMQYAKQYGFARDNDDEIFSDDYHFLKNRSDIGTGKTDKLLFGIKQYWNSINFDSYDENIETEYKKLLATGEFKETKTQKGIPSGIQKSFTSKSYPDYIASITFQKEAGKNYYSILVMRLIKPQ